MTILYSAAPQPSFRLVPSRYPPIGLFDTVSTAAEAKVVMEGRRTRLISDLREKERGIACRELEGVSASPLGQEANHGEARFAPVPGKPCGAHHPRNHHPP